MSDQMNADYFRMRAEEERLRGRDASDPRAAAAHAEMAGRYEELAADFAARRPAISIAG